MNQINPRAVVGDNQAPAYAERITEQLDRDYSAYAGGIDTLLEKARTAPTEINDDATATAVGLIVKELRDTYNRGEAYRTSEKEPHLRSAEAVDSFFFRLMERLRRRNPRDRTQKPGAADILQARIDDYLERKRIEEDNRRRAEAERLRREQEERDRIAREQFRRAEEARLAAERARNAERIAEKKAIADAAEKAAQQAKMEAELAAQQAQEAHISALAKPAEMARTRGDGVLLTQAQEGYVILTDRLAITSEAAMALLPYFTNAEIEKAARGFAKATNHSKQLAGFEIGFRRKGVTR